MVFAAQDDVLWSELKPGESITLSSSELAIVRGIQVRQFTALAQRETARAEMEKARAAQQLAERDLRDAQKLLDAANREMTTEQNDLRAVFHCPDCELRGEELLLTRPAPSDVTVVPNK